MEYKAIDTHSAYGRLGELARRPFDLTAEGAITGERLSRYRCSAAGFDLLYGTERIDDEVIDALSELAEQAGLIEQFEAMRGGAVMNRIEGYASEERQVLHTSCRDVFDDEPAAPEASALARAQLEKLRQFLTELDEGTLVNAAGEPFDTLVQVGIGGSDLGPRALALALSASWRAGRDVRFVSNVDPDDAAAVLGGLDLSRTLINVVSKSGTTLETLTNEWLARVALERAGLDSARHLVAVTGEGSPMDDESRYLRSFHMYDFIGGRYSATSMVGGVALGFALGSDGFEALLRGAHEADQAAAETDLRQNLPLLLALIGVWNRSFLGHDSVAILPYSQALHRFTAHLQQCDMESNGKSVDRLGRPLAYDTGPIVWGEPGTNGQHAFFQLLHQGTTVVPAEFIGFRQSQYGEDLEVEGTSSQQKLVANMLAQVLALAAGQPSDNPNRRFEGNRPSVVLIAERLDPRTMGALLAIYEAKIVFQGFLWNINSFDQEGVQLGKVLARRLLGHLAGEGGGDDPVGRALLEVAGVDGEALSGGAGDRRR